MIKDFLEQFLFFPNKDIKKTPSIINIEYQDVFLEYNEDIDKLKMKHRFERKLRQLQEADYTSYDDGSSETDSIESSWT